MHSFEELEMDSQFRGSVLAHWHIRISDQLAIDLSLIVEKSK